MLNGSLNLNTSLPSRWRARGSVDVQAFAPTLRQLRDRARETYGAAYAAGLISSTMLVALIRADAMCVLASQSGPVDGRAYAVAVTALIAHLTDEDAE